MTSPATTQAPGLWIQGPAALGFPPPRGGYARGAYGDVSPDAGPAAWLVVHPSGRVTAFAGKVEYGQGIRWGFAVEVADELALPLGDVEVVLGDTDATPWDMGTFGSQSTWRTGLQLRRAAATARRALLELAASRLDLPASELHCRDGRIASTHDPSRSVGYGDLIGDARRLLDLDEEAPLTAAADFSVMGSTSGRVDARARVTGEARYSQDIQRPGMLFAWVLRPPTYGATLRGVDTGPARQAPGVVDVVQDGALVAVLAESDEGAEMAGALLRAEWDERARVTSPAGTCPPCWPNRRRTRSPRRRPATWRAPSRPPRTRWSRRTSRPTSRTRPWSRGRPSRSGTPGASPSGRARSGRSPSARSWPATSASRRGACA